jgi:S1-C subfamily serine protease
MSLKKQAIVAASTLALVSSLTTSFIAYPSQAATPLLIAADGATALSTLGPNTIADITQGAAPAVVNIDVIQSQKTAMGRMGGFNFPGMPNNDIFQFFFNGQRINPRDMGMGGDDAQPTPKKAQAVPAPKPGAGATQPKAQTAPAPKPVVPSPRSFPERRDTGSGFIVRKDGYILTNAHVVQDAEKIRVTLNDKRSFDGKVVGVDHFSDLAVIKIDGTDLPVLPLGTSSTIRPGEFAIAIGSPLGYDHTVTLGIISAVGRTVTDVNGNINFIQTDAAINPGNSGGPLLNLSGEVIGVNTAIRRNAQNIGFSIPIDVAKTVSESLIASGKILRPWLGIRMQELDENAIKAWGLDPKTKGVLIQGFMNGSPAKSAGLHEGDVIIKIDGKPMPAAKDVKDYVMSKKVSDTLAFGVMRSDGLQTVNVNIGNYDDIMVNKPKSIHEEPDHEGGE